MKKKILFGLLILVVLVAVLSADIINTGDSNVKEIKTDVEVNSDAQINTNNNAVNVKYNFNDDNSLNVNVFNVSNLYRNRFLWATYENNKLVEIEQQEIFNYPFNYTTKPLDFWKTGRLIIWDDLKNEPVINKVIENKD